MAAAIFSFKLLQRELPAQHPPDTLGQPVTKNESQELSLGSGLLPELLTQDGERYHTLFPEPYNTHCLHPQAPLNIKMLPPLPSSVG